MHSLDKSSMKSQLVRLAYAFPEVSGTVRHYDFEDVETREKLGFVDVQVGREIKSSGTILGSSFMFELLQGNGLAYFCNQSYKLDLNDAELNITNPGFELKFRFTRW